MMHKKPKVLKVCSFHPKWIVWILLFMPISYVTANNTYQALPFSQNWSNTSLITTSNDWSNVPGIIGYRGDNLATTGQNPQTVLADGTSTPVNVQANQTNPNTNTTGGNAEFHITDPVVAFQGSGTADAPFLLIHLNTFGFQNITVTYNLRDIDGSTDNSIQQVALHYRVGTSGAFTDVPAAYVADASTGPSQATLVTPVSVTLPVDCNNQAQIQIRMMTCDASGNDEWIGVDDINVTGDLYMDFGDAPQSPYPTRLAANGARHGITSLFMGLAIDGEADGQPSAKAVLDDASGLPDDEDGVIFAGMFAQGFPATIIVTSSGNGLLDAWVDWNDDGDWADPGEQIFINQPVVPGPNALTILVPPPPISVITSQTFARFRLSSGGGLTYIGPALDGEVEDYEVAVLPESEFNDFGDAPDPAYPTLKASSGAEHFISLLYMGANIDSEFDGQPTIPADGDDINPPGLDDEDGVAFGPLIPGMMANVTVTVTMGLPPPVYLNAWIDFNNNGSWADAGEQIFVNQVMIPGVNNLAFMVPAGASTGFTYARFRINCAGNLSYIGFAIDGEVEDYQVFIEPGVEETPTPTVTVTATATEIPPEIDFGDAPDPLTGPGQYPTLLINNGARHMIVPGLFMGGWIDAEADGQPTGLADGDDLNPPGLNDEDGVAFSPIMVGQQATVLVTIGPIGGRLTAWIDWNMNGIWLGDPQEQIALDFIVNPGPNVVIFNVPPFAVAGPTYARFRFYSEANYGNPMCNFDHNFCPDGEVEDYLVHVEPVPTETPTTVPTNTPTLVPTNTPTLIPTNTPTLVPTVTPTMIPTDTPTVVPTNTPTLVPTETPTLVPTSTPTSVPTETPTFIPTHTPTEVPTVTPFGPTATPTEVPPVPAADPAGTGILILFLTALLGLHGFRRKK